MSLKRTAFSAGRWTAASAAFVAGTQLLQTMVLARLLLPAEFGLMAVAAAILAVLALLADMGFSRALIHFDHMSSETLSSLYWLNLGMGLLLAALLALAAPALGAAYRSTALVPVLQGASLLFPLTALGQQFRVMAEKELRFAALARNEAAAAAIGFCAAIVVALMHGGVYALVAGMLVNAMASSLLAWWRLSDGHRPSTHFRLRDTRPYLRFGGYMVGDSFTNTLNRQADVFIGGLVLSPAVVGVYSVPRDLSLRVAALVNPVITRVGFPVMSRVKDDRDQLKSIYLQTLRLTASVNFPMYVALGLFANEIVGLLYGPRWHPAAQYLRVLAAWGLVRSVGNPVGSLLYAVGRARLAFWWNVALLVVSPPILWAAASAAGLMGLAWGLLGLNLMIVVPMWRLLLNPACGVRFDEYLSAITAPLLIAGASGFAAWIATVGIHGSIARLAIGGGVGGIVYVGLSYLYNRAWTDAMVHLFDTRKTS